MVTSNSAKLVAGGSPTPSTFSCMLLSASPNFLLIFIRQGLPGLPCRVRRTRYEFSSRCQVTGARYTRPTYGLPDHPAYTLRQYLRSASTHPTLLPTPPSVINRKAHWSTAPRKHRHRSSLVVRARFSSSGHARPSFGWVSEAESRTASAACPGRSQTVTIHISLQSARQWCCMRRNASPASFSISGYLSL